MLEFTIATISVFVAALNELVKTISMKCFNYDIKKFIPLFSVGFGLILGILGYFAPNITMGNNIVEAIFIGIASGGNAVGFHQIYKQLYKGNININYDSDVDDETPPSEDPVVSEDEAILMNHVEEEPEEEASVDDSTVEDESIETLIDEDIEDYTENE
jgi:hypothetical protein